MQAPTDEQIRSLHQKYAPTKAAFERVYGHCVIVDEIAQQLIKENHLDVDADLVHAGCLVHDIGVYALYKNGVLDGQNYITHGVLGEKILQDESYPQQLQRMAANHTGVGLSRHDVKAQHLPIPERDYIAVTPEEQIVMYADKFHSKTTPPYFNSVAWFLDHIAQFGVDKADTFKKMVAEYGEPDLEALSGKYGYLIR
jgi:uncharacterized protein